MDQVQLVGDVQPFDFTVQWTRLSTSGSDTGRDPIIGYTLEWNEITDPTNDVWTQLLLAQETESTFIVMHNNTPGYKINTQYNIRVAGINNVGTGIYSDSLVVLTDNAPVRMNTPEEDSATNATQIFVKWDPISALTDTGRDEVFFYKLEWD